MISAATHIARLVRAAFVFAREGVFGVVDPSLVPPHGQLALRLARLIERPGGNILRLGPVHHLEGDDVVVWIRKDATAPLRITVAPAGPDAAR